MEAMNPVEMLKDDHKKVNEMMEEYEGSEMEEKKRLAMQIAEELAVHMEMEESIFYPMLEKASAELKEMAAEGREEHKEIKAHIAQIDIEGGETEMDGHIEMIKKGVLHHVEEEENEMFPKTEEELADEFESLAERMQEFKSTAKGPDLLSKLISRKS